MPKSNVRSLERQLGYNVEPALSHGHKHLQEIKAAIKGMKRDYPDSKPRALESDRGFRQRCETLFHRYGPRVWNTRYNAPGTGHWTTDYPRPLLYSLLEDRERLCDLLHNLCLEKCRVGRLGQLDKTSRARRETHAAAASAFAGQSTQQADIDFIDFEDDVQTESEDSEYRPPGTSISSEQNQSSEHSPVASTTQQRRLARSGRGGAQIDLADSIDDEGSQDLDVQHAIVRYEMGDRHLRSTTADDYHLLSPPHTGNTLRKRGVSFRNSNSRKRPRLAHAETLAGPGAAQPCPSNAGANMYDQHEKSNNDAREPSGPTFRLPSVWLPGFDNGNHRAPTAIMSAGVEDDHDSGGAVQNDCEILTSHAACDPDTGLDDNSGHESPNMVHFLEGGPWTSEDNTTTAPDQGRVAHPSCAANEDHCPSRHGNVGASPDRPVDSPMSPRSCHNRSAEPAVYSPPAADTDTSHRPAINKGKEPIRSALAEEQLQSLRTCRPHGPIASPTGHTLAANHSERPRAMQAFEDPKSHGSLLNVDTTKFMLVDWKHKDNELTTICRLMRYAYDLWDVIKKDMPSSFRGKTIANMKRETVRMSAAEALEQYGDDECIARNGLEDCMKFLVNEAFGADGDVKRTWWKATVKMKG